MCRFNAFLFCAAFLMAAAVIAAPGPSAIASKKSGPWFDGWNQPVKPGADCGFERKGDRLTITLTGKGYGLEVEKGKLNVPHLLREFKGDFVVQVRISGNFQQGKLGDGLRRAGILVAHRNHLVRYTMSAEPGKKSSPAYFGDHTLGWKGGLNVYNRGVALDKPGFLRMERRLETTREGRRYSLYRMYYSADGKRWLPFQDGESGSPLPDQVKVGVYAESTVPGTFKAEFDQWKLTPLGGKKR